MNPTLIRRQLGGLVPPKIATPGLVVINSSNFQGKQLTLALNASPVDRVLLFSHLSIFIRSYQKEQRLIVCLVSKDAFSLAATRQESH